MRALKVSTSPQEKQQLDAKCKDWISRAEKIKSDKAWTPAKNPATQNMLKEPVSQRKLSKREEIILLESAKLNGSLFPPWQNEPSQEEFELPGKGEKFESVFPPFDTHFPRLTSSG